MDGDHLGYFDLLLTSTDIHSASHAAKYAREGKKVLVVDQSGRYGSNVHGSSDPLSLLEAFPDKCCCEESFLDELRKSQKFNKKFILDAHPWILSVAGPTCARLVADQVSKYLEFRPIQRNAIITSKGERLFVPTSKEDIFMDSNLSLIEKRQLSKMLTLKIDDEPRRFKEVIDDFTEKLKEIIIYGLLMCNDKNAEDITCKDAYERLLNYRDGLGRYGTGNAPFLFPLYGTSEISQAYCRQAAVHGVTFIMGQEYQIMDNFISGEFDGKKWTADFAETLVQEPISDMVNRLTVVLDGPFAGEWGTNVWTIVNTDGSVTRMICTSIDSGCAPQHFYIAHAWSDSELLSFPGDDPNVLFSYAHTGPRPILGSYTEFNLTLF